MPKVTHTDARGLFQTSGTGVDLQGMTTIRACKIQNVNADKNLTSADCGVVILGAAVGATQAASTGFNVNLPTPAAGLYFKFILRPAAIANNSNAAITITCTSDGTTAANNGVGSVLVNGSPTNVTAAKDIVTFVHNAATCGDQVECWNDGTNWFFNIIADASGAVTLA